MEKRFSFFKFIKKQKIGLILTVLIFLIFVGGSYGFNLFRSEKTKPSLIEPLDEAQNFLNRLIIYINQPTYMIEDAPSKIVTRSEDKHKATNNLLIDNFEENLLNTDVEKKGITFSNFYRSIKQEENNLVTEEEFREYIEKLNISLGTKIINYQAMSEEETEKYTARFKQSGIFAKDLKNARFYWFITERDNIEQRFPFVLWLNNSGKVSLHKEWINQSLKLHQLMDNYWQAITQGKKEVIKSFLRYNEINNDKKEAWLDLKVKYLLDYYQKYFKEDEERWQRRFEALAFMGDYIQYRQPLLKEVQKTFQSIEEDDVFFRFIEISFYGNNQVHFFDNIPQKLDNSQFAIFRNGRRILSLGEVIEGSRLIDYFGWWGDGLKVSNLNKATNIVNDEKKEQKILLTYPGVEIEIHGQFNPQNNYLVGNVVRISVNKIGYTSKFDLGVDSSLEDLWHYYPFIDNHNFNLYNLEGRFLKFKLKDNRIEAFELSWDK